ncbi:hypothetical protein BMS3Abin05_01673 [bacterium BMS3Abin05]|nr:hypothetical protein BMS3Abin05_01673 [bacterium BMS3Abin05]
MIYDYPKFSEISLDDRDVLHPLFQRLDEGISEFTFANIYLFRKNHHYKISRIRDDLYLITGHDNGEPFFILPFGLPEPEMLQKLFLEFHGMKIVSENQAKLLTRLGYSVKEDRDNFDYLYTRTDLAGLPGRKFSKKRNLVKLFVNNHNYRACPLFDSYREDALSILEKWCRDRDDIGDCDAAREALEKMQTLQLCGTIYYVDDQPVAFTLGEELVKETSYVIHFEKAVGNYKGLYQFINKAFASMLPECYKTINREQDLGNEGLRHAKMSYKPIGFIKKYRCFFRVHS